MFTGWRRARFSRSNAAAGAEKGSKNGQQAKRLAARRLTSIISNRSTFPVGTIDNGTLHLIQSVVEYLMQDLKTNRCDQGNSKGRTALDELRMEFEDIRVRLHESPEQFIVLSELAIRSWRDPSIAKMFKRLDDGWYAHLVALLKRGIEQGLFRKDLDTALCARAIMVALRGIGYQSRLPRRELDALLSELAALTEHWVKAELVRRRK